MMPVDPPEQGEFASLTLIALGDTPEAGGCPMMHELSTKETNEDFGAGEGNRTLYTQLGKLMFYH